MKKRRNLVFDYGASNGRAFFADYDGTQLTLSEVHRFPNDPVRLNGTLYWDFLRLWHEMKQGLEKAAAEGGFDAVAVDTWGLDFGLLDRHGQLIETPVHYRDERCAGMIESVREQMADRALYSRTGIQFMRINTIYQLAALQKSRPELLERAEDLLLMPDLFGYFLTGERVQEYSMASTTGLLNARTRDWDPEILDTLGLPERLFHPVTMPGRPLGGLTKALREELSLPEAQVLTVAGHDTGSAVASVPAQEEEFAYISSGTWSLLGAETREPVLSKQAFSYNFTNEGGVNGSIRLLKNIMGLWIIQECRRRWRVEGRDYDYPTIAAMAEAAEPGIGRFDPDDESLIAPLDMPGAVRALCEKSGEGVPQTDGSLARCIYENLARKYREVFLQLQEVTGVTYRKLYVVGGGSQNQLLNQMTADALGVPVLAGPGEATVIGNAMVQLMAQGEITSLRQGRGMIAQNGGIKTFFPR